MNDLPPHVIGVRATGEVSKDDYKNVLLPALERFSKAHGHIHFLMLLETTVKNFTIGALLEDAKLGLKNFTRWHKIAIVSNEKGVKKLSDIFSFAVPGESKGFSVAELEQAIQWVAS
jgi:hypothetical protein